MTFLDQQLELYKASWRQVWQPKTLLHSLFDILLFLLLALFLSLSSVIVSFFAEPLLPVIEAINQLESQGASQADRLALIQTFNPEINGAIFKSVIGIFLLGILFVFAYALFKRLTWNSLLAKGFSVEGYRSSSLRTLAFFGTLFLPFLLLPVSPVATAYALIALVALLLLLLPLLYATDDLLARAKHRVPRWWLWIMIIIILWLAIGTILSFIGLLNGIFMQEWFWAVRSAIAFLSLGPLLALCLWLLRKRLGAWLHAYLVLLGLTGATWLLLSNILFGLSILSTSFYIIVSSLAFLLFLAWHRYYLSLYVKKYLEGKR